MTITRTILQAPWRTRRQRVGVVLLGIVGAIMVSALYLSVASHATLLGREIQKLEREISLTRQENANLKTDLAYLLSYSAVESRSELLGFYPADTEEIHYILVPGYDGKEAITLQTEISLSAAPSSLPKEYSQSLFDWLRLELR